MSDHPDNMDWDAFDRNFYEGIAGKCVVCGGLVDTDSDEYCSPTVEGNDLLWHLDCLLESDGAVMGKFSVVNCPSHNFVTATEVGFTYE